MTSLEFFDIDNKNPSLVRSIMNKIKFENLPSKKTPLSAEILNTMQDNIEKAIGEIIESGSNSNGEYIKFSDGTMICRKYINFGQKAISNKWGSFYESEKITIGNYPEPFIEIPQIFIMPLNTFFIEKESSSLSITY